MKKKEPEVNDPPVQMAIDPTTGKDITTELIENRLRELEILADKIIDKAVRDSRHNPQLKSVIYKEAYQELHEKLGMGSIGPATAAAGPLMYKKMEKLADLMEIPNNKRF